MCKKILKFSSLLLLFVIVLTGCSMGGNKKSKLSRYSRVVYDVYNTTVTLYMYDENKIDKVFKPFKELAVSLHKEMDRDNNYEGINNLKTINDSYGSGNAISVSDNLIEVLELSLKMTELTEGYFNMAMGTIIDVWAPRMKPRFNDETGEFIYTNTDPAASYIDGALKCVPTVSELKEILIIDKANKTVTLNRLDSCVNYNDESGNTITGAVKISLGGIGKGYAMDKLKDLYLSKYPDDPALIDGGTSSLHMIGQSPTVRTVGGKENHYWVIAPAAPRTLQYEQLCRYARTCSATVSTSGNAANYFFLVDSEGHDVVDEYGLQVLRTHIINPFTGMSEQYYDTINVVSDIDAGVLDALTTALYNINDLNKVKEIIQTVEEEFGISIDYSFSKLIKNTAGELQIVVHMGQSMKDRTYDYNDKIVENYVF